jgi:hypothetical protein
MLVCGRDWQPTRVRRVIETHESSTRVAKVATDVGNGFLKGTDIAKVDHVHRGEHHLRIVRSRRSRRSPH